MKDKVMSRYNKPGEEPLLHELMDDPLVQLVLKRDNQCEQSFKTAMNMAVKQNNAAKKAAA